MTHKLQAKNILLIEDNPADVRLTREALATANISHRLYTVNDGIHVLPFLNKEDKYSDMPRPDLILLDLNLPLMDGRKVLEKLKTHEHLSRIPVIVLTTSKREEDIAKAYTLHANCYVVKSIDFDQFCCAIKSLGNFWCSVAELPPDSSTALTN